MLLAALVPLEYTNDLDLSPWKLVCLVVLDHETKKHVKALTKQIIYKLEKKCTMVTDIWTDAT